MLLFTPIEIEQKLLEDPNFKLIQPRKATLDQIKYVHEDKLIQQVRSMCDVAEQTGQVQCIMGIHFYLPRLMKHPYIL